MSNRYADDVRRIVGIDRNQSNLGQAPNRLPIGARRGIGYKVADENKSQSGTPGQTQLPGAGDLGEGEDTNPENQNGQQGSNPNNPNNNIKDGNSPGVNLEDIVNGTADEAKMDAPVWKDDGLGYEHHLDLRRLNAVDCETGKELSLELDGQFVPPTAESITDPDTGEEVKLGNDWTNPDTPPDSLNFHAGYYWQYGVGASLNINVEYSSNSSNWTTYKEAQLAVYRNDPSKTVTLLPELTVVAYGEEGLPADALTSFRVTYDVDPSPGIIPIGAKIVQCPGPSGTAVICALTEDFPETCWPTQLKTQIALNGGQFFAHPLDCGADIKYTTPNGSLDLCYGDGGDNHARIQPTAYGGFMIIPTLESGVPSGDPIRVYDAERKLIYVGIGHTHIIDGFVNGNSPFVEE